MRKINNLNKFQKKNNRKGRKAKSLLINNSEDDPLIGGIIMPIEEADESENNSVKDDNGVGVQLSQELEATVEPMRPTRTRRLPLKYQSNRI